MEGDQTEQALIEALILASGEPIAAKRLAEASGVEEAAVEAILKGIAEKYSAESFGFELVNVADQFQFRTKSQFAERVRQLKGSLPRRLSSAALETLSIVAYRQPIVRSDIERIRGVDVTPTLKTLLERGLVKIVGHQATVGQPALFGTTEEFLKLFGLSSLSQLPTLNDLRDLERDPGETGEGGEEESESQQAVAAESEEEPAAEEAAPAEEALPIAAEG